MVTADVHVAREREKKLQWSIFAYWAALFLSIGELNVFGIAGSPSVRFGR
jgi:uncharacterized membrane protein